ncbi:isopenicillin N synthase family dioxygenase [Sediminicoccus rosea]|jgi:isopenicillin N synthase-like dioxygenase|uniref:2-oxoglutarate-dependent ethylene/succinate-forming enzyme n=1 Tax=Sediminicoccus rosea TaxID=1225128 RepID=A0ABZ0PMF7_9PROT|nr:2-oxoglutarate and iron-dependent oxygenase domain-containing protein [Sediminicoccus rosea]WPB86896.1 2-oxoglutarate and iron-dependent oxygenase domain-containing protein [Sediminicoccus rosea]
MSAVPVIDLSPIRGTDAAAITALGRKVDAACREIGFLIVEGHGVSPDLIAEVRRESHAFFDLPEAEKLAVRPPPGTMLRGYTPPETNTLARSRGVETPPDMRSLFSMGRPEADGTQYADIPEARPFYQPNLWPGRPAGLRPAFTAYFREMERLSTEIMRAFAVGLGLPVGFFDDKIDNHFAALHALHYGARTTPAAPGQLRAGAHSDFGSLTILMPPAEGGMGLEVQRPDGSFAPVEPPPGAYVINIGDLMQQWTNERWVSTVHRVVNPEGEGWAKPRLSLGFFCHPNYDAPVEALPGTVPAGEAPRHAPVLAGVYMNQKISAVRRPVATS